MDNKILFLALLTSMMWGLTGIFVKLLPMMSPVTLTGLRLTIALLVSLPLFWLMRRDFVSFKNLLIRPVSYVFAGLLTGYYLLATTAFQLAPVAEVALLLSTPPLFILFFLILVGKRPLRAKFIGALMATIGIGFILMPQMTVNSEVSSQSILGHGFAMAAAMLTAVYAYHYSLLQERGNAPNALEVSMLTFGLGALMLIVQLLIRPASFEFVNLTGQMLWLLLGLGLLSTAIPSIGFALASKGLPAMVTATISLLIPVFAALFALFLLNEQLSETFIPGAILVLGGVLLLVRK
ncbi:MAG: DMT family transporter [Thiomicrospira sp.]